MSRMSMSSCALTEPLDFRGKLRSTGYQDRVSLQPSVRRYLPPRSVSCAGPLYQCGASDCQVALALDAASASLASEHRKSKRAHN